MESEVILSEYKLILKKLLEEKFLLSRIYYKSKNSQRSFRSFHLLQSVIKRLNTLEIFTKGESHNLSNTDQNKILPIYKQERINFLEICIKDITKCGGEFGRQIQMGEIVPMSVGVFCLLSRIGYLFQAILSLLKREDLDESTLQIMLFVFPNEEKKLHIKNTQKVQAKGKILPIKRTQNERKGELGPKKSEDLIKIEKKDDLNKSGVWINEIFSLLENSNHKKKKKKKKRLSKSNLNKT